jgi:hypothetical protein
MNQNIILAAPLAVLILLICGIDDPPATKSSRQHPTVFSQCAGKVEKNDDNLRIEPPSRVACNNNGDLYLLKPGQEVLPGEQLKMYPNGAHQASGILQNHFFHSSIE